MPGTDRHFSTEDRRSLCWIVLLGVAMLGCWPAVGRAGEFETANQVYDQGKFAEAKEGYEKLIESGAGSANVYYNLGNADFRLGSAGRAMLGYERALALSPRHPEAQANLKLLRQQNGAKLRPLSWSERIAVNLPADAWSIVAAVAGWVVLFGLVLILTNRQRGNLGWWTLALLSAAVCAVAVGSLWSGPRDQTPAIVTAQQTEA